MALPFKMVTQGNNKRIVFTHWSFKYQQLGVLSRDYPPPTNQTANWCNIVKQLILLDIPISCIWNRYPVQCELHCTQQYTHPPTLALPVTKSWLQGTIKRGGAKASCDHVNQLLIVMPAAVTELPLSKLVKCSSHCTGYRFHIQEIGIDRRI